jgi:hypothetical protein
MGQFGDRAEERQQRRDSSCSAAHVHNVRTQMRDEFLSMRRFSRVDLFVIIHQNLLLILTTDLADKPDQSLM